MSNRLPIEVNPFRLIEQRRTLSGEMALQQLPRVQAAVETASSFAVEMEFMHSSSGLPMIAGAVKGDATLVCQRCLGRMRVHVDTHFNVVLTVSQTDRQPEEEGYDLYIVEDERLFVQDFIEDEVLLAFPVIPRHEQCKPVRVVQEVMPTDVVEPIEYPEVEGRKNPFAALKDWKKTE